MTAKEQESRRLIARALAYVCLVGSINWPGSLQPATTALAKSSHKESKDQGKGSKKHKSSKTASGTGLDKSTLEMVNSGDWKSACDRLETLTANKTQIGKEQSWLAFAYMFLYKCDQLKALAAKAGVVEEPAGSVKAGALDQAGSDKGTPAKVETVTPDNVYVVLIQAYSQMCQQKFDLADRTLKSLPSHFAQDDPEVTFALAAIAGKQGRVGAAVEYTKRTVDMAPDFGWGYRTIGFLQERFLKDYDKADAALMQAVEINPNMREAAEKLVDMRLSRNNFDGALDVAEQVLKASPKESANYYRIAQIYVQQWRLREALSKLEEAIALAPNEARFYRSRANIKRCQGDLNAAIADQQKAVEFSKDKAFELGELASMNIAAGNKNRAIDNLQEALKFDAANQTMRDRLSALLLEEKRYDDIVTFYQQSLEKKTGDAKLRLGLAMALAHVGKADLAVEEFKKAANLDSTDPEPHRQLGALRINQNDYAAAAKEYTRALNINPASVPDLVALGFCYAHNDDYLQAEAAFVTSLALQQLTQSNSPNATPTRLQINRSLASLLLDEGRYSDSAAQFEAICAQSKGTADGALDSFMLAQAKAMRDRSNASAQAAQAAYNALTAEQKTQYRNALAEGFLIADKVQMAVDLLAGASGNTDVVSTVELAKLNRLKGEFSKAEQMALQVVSNKDANAEQKSNAQEELAQIMLAKGDLEKADSWAHKAVDDYSKNYRAYETLGRINLKKGNLKEAIDNANKSTGINPYYTKAYLLMGDAQQGSGAIKDASLSYRKAAELYPGLLEAHKSLLSTLQKLSLKDEARKEEEQIAVMEKQR